MNSILSLFYKLLSINLLINIYTFPKEKTLNIFKAGENMPKTIEPRANNKYILTVSGGYLGKDQVLYRKTVICKNLTEATKQYALFKAECLKGKHLASTDEKMTLDQFYDFWKENYAQGHLSTSTINNEDYLYDRISKAFGGVRIDKINNLICVSFFENLRTVTLKNKTLSPETIKKHYKLLNKLFNFAVKWDVVQSNPLNKVDRPKAQKGIKIMPSQDDIAKLANHIFTKKELNHKLWFMLALGMGLRREEIFGLQIKDIDLKTKTIAINRAVIYLSGQGIQVVPTKTKTSARNLTMPEMIFVLMQKYIQSLKIIPLEGWLFYNQNKITQPDAFNNMLKRACKTLGINRITPHTLRHMYGSNLIKQGIDIALTSKQLGHTNKGFTLNTYIHVVETNDDRAAIASQSVLENIIPAKL